MSMLEGEELMERREREIGLEREDNGRSNVSIIYYVVVRVQHIDRNLISSRRSSPSSHNTAQKIAKCSSEVSLYFRACNLSSLARFDPPPLRTGSDCPTNLRVHKRPIRIPVRDEGVSQQFLGDRSIFRTGCEAFLVQKVIRHG
jgi:hypothetical protein